MISDSSVSPPIDEAIAAAPPAPPQLDVRQVYFKPEAERLLLYLPPLPNLAAIDLDTASESAIPEAASPDQSDPLPATDPQPAAIAAASSALPGQDPTDSPGQPVTAPPDSTPTAIAPEDAPPDVAAVPPEASATPPGDQTDPSSTRPPAELAETPDLVAANWAEVWLQLKHRLQSGDRFWQPHTPVHLVARDRLLDQRQLQAIAAALKDKQLDLTRVYTSRRQTAVAAATAGYAVEQQAPRIGRRQRPDLPAAAPSQPDNPTAPTAEPTPLAEPLYVQATVRSGVEIQHPGTVVVLGDVNPGGAIVADGDILVWGRLRGFVHAGARGQSTCLIMALHMQPTQIRIADQVARGPADPPPANFPEVAHSTADGIRIAPALEFRRGQPPATA